MTKEQRRIARDDDIRGFRHGWEVAMTARVTNAPEAEYIRRAWSPKFRGAFAEGREAGRIATLGEPCPVAAVPGG